VARRWGYARSARGAAQCALLTNELIAMHLFAAVDREHFPRPRLLASHQSCPGCAGRVRAREDVIVWVKPLIVHCQRPKKIPVARRNTRRGAVQRFVVWRTSLAAENSMVDEGWNGRQTSACTPGTGSVLSIFSSFCSRCCAPGRHAISAAITAWPPVLLWRSKRATISPCAWLQLRILKHASSQQPLRAPYKEGSPTRPLDSFGLKEWS